MSVPTRELHRVIPTVMIYNQDRKYLIVQRGMDLKVHPGKWHCPGGGLSMDDYDHLPSSTPHATQWYGVIENGLRREVREEVGLEIGKPEFLLDLAFVRPDGVPCIVLSYFAPYASGEVVVSEEAVSHVWVSLAEAQGYDMIDGMLDEMAMIDAILKERGI
jgi:8-oxo-dGTP pyrophosphatase MutT (NUDIX family)